MYPYLAKLLIYVSFCSHNIRGPLEKFVDWRQCTAVMQREAVIVMPNCSGGVNVVVALSSSL
jgi:hypothetical protein